MNILRAFCFSLVASNLLVNINFITNHISFHYFLKLGRDSLFYTFNEGRRQSLSSGSLNTVELESWPTLNQERVHLRLARRNLGAKERSFKLVNFVYISARPRVASAFLRSFQLCFDPSGCGPSCNYEILQKSSGEIA